MRYVAWILICLLVVLHQCTFPWQSEKLYLGFIPGVLATVLGTMLAGLAIYKREMSQLFKELET